ncbi:taste receptor type 2 member 143-like [Bombina bombina]|uniref:taste receptor type 2 member 143-like n=1 Tax=Bombina bombina TaxID=8345 RepID=UPI00235A92BF|nr:taste receptor type 2 member 143-like [Bombina bombina]
MIETPSSIAVTSQDIKVIPSTVKMDYISLIFSGTSLALAIPLHTIIITVSVRTWYKVGFQSPADLIILSLDLCNFIAQILALFEYGVYYLSDGHYSLYIYYGIFSGISICCSWITAWLCTFFCIKIVSFQHRLITYMKMRFSILIPHLIVGSFVICTSAGTLTFVTFAKCVPFTDTDNNSLSINNHHYFYKQSYNYILMHVVEAFMCLATLLSLMSLGLTISSLSLHILKNYGGASNIHFSQLKVHIRAVIVMILLLTLEIFYYLAWLFSEPPDDEIAEYWVCITFYYLSFPLKALTLIFGNRKLSRVCWDFICTYRSESPQSDE